MYILPETITAPPGPHLVARQTVTSTSTATVTAVTTTAGVSSPAAGCPGQYSGGAVAGAVLGTFFGTLLVLYLFSIINIAGGPAFVRTGKEEVIVEKRVRSRRNGDSHSSVRRPSRVYSSRG